ncbi:penicillin acylase family protein [Nocardioides sp. AE5]|uniref:penicillin acylase family protein n=1 Tax=Nocardioides sp. AE5 TaxID=2962573 RepID=UPI002880E333|nr:penicillin acylase family protein [Nocardioides sp. AE5]MDT0203013.1 penicillin acylase family protein [Nocardioides sp. AE5]
MASRTHHDQHGIPRITADSVPELAFAQGVEQVTSRAAQLETERLRSQGRISERLGRAGLEWDRFARRSRIDAIAERAHDRLDAETREFLVAFTDGINTTFGERRWMPWTPCGAFLVQQLLFGSFPHKLWRQRVHDVLGPAGMRALSVSPPAVGGSNAYAVTGDRTASGRPIVAGDPHRVFEAPNVYLQVHLACPEFDVIGFTFPGVPGVQHFAHTGTVAWGLTNAMGDYQDLYAEELRRTADGVEALGPDGWAPAEVHTEEITIRGEAGTDSEAEQVEVIVTERGPVILGEVDDHPVSLRTPSHDLGDLGFSALLPLLRARSVADVEAAIDGWVEPVNTWIIADTTGAVVQRVAGRVPVRNEANRHGIVPAASADHRWTGWAPLPRLLPTDGRVVSANDRASEEYTGIGSHFAQPWRAQRITALVDAAGPLTAGGAIAPLLDVRQLGGDALLAAVAALDGLAGPAARVQQVLAGWDREMSVDGLGAATFTAVRAEFTARVAAHPALAGLADPTTYGGLLVPWLALPSRVGPSVPNLLRHGHGLGIDTPALLRAAVESVADRVQAAGGHTAWGDRHRFTPLTPLAHFGLPDADLAVTGEPLPGDMDCVAAFDWLPGTDLCLRGPVARYVWDLADRSASRWAVPLGAHGSPDSPHHTDQFEAWRSGTLLPVDDAQEDA